MIHTLIPEQLVEGHVGRIPIRNLWLLMLYASELFRMRGSGRVGLEENQDDVPDLVAEILCAFVERRLRQNLSYGYLPRQSIVSRVRGQIDFLETESHHLLSRGAIACRFEDLTVNTPRNRLVRAALESISRIVRRHDLAHRCRVAANDLKRLGVSGEQPTRLQVSTDRFGRHDASDEHMVAAAKLALELMLPTEETGDYPLSIPEREFAWVTHLYEKAIGGFYDVVLTPRGWHVDVGRSLNWIIEARTSGIDAILPSMRTDVVLEHVDFQRRIVIDTKFNSILTAGWHRDRTIRSSHVYQIYAYLRSQDGSVNPLAAHASGLLLHPSIGETIDETVVIQGHSIRFATVDLSAEVGEVRKQLLARVEPETDFVAG
jgi:5-methylcytosine-specific restriction enzyme subunit McrC